MRSPLVPIAITICSLACYRPASVNMRPDSFLSRPDANAYRQKDERWLVVLELANPSGTLNWGVDCNEQIEIQLIKAAPKTRAQWYVTKDRWETGVPFEIRITTDNGAVVPVKITYSTSVIHPVLAMALSFL